jgi:hypothetical protein
MVARPVPVSDLRIEEIDDDICLYRDDIDEVLVLNATAANVWRLADGRSSVAQMVDALADFYQTTPASIHDDVTSTIADLERRGYLTDAGDPQLSTDSSPSGQPDA